MHIQLLIYWPILLRRVPAWMKQDYMTFQLGWEERWG